MDSPTDGFEVRRLPKMPTIPGMAGPSIRPVCKSGAEAAVNMGAGDGAGGGSGLAAEVALVNLSIC